MRARWIGLAGVVVGGLGWAAWTAWRGRLEIAGVSMEPVLRQGDRVICVPLVFRSIRPSPYGLRTGQLIALADPRQPRRVMVKRLAAIDSAGLWVRSDNPVGTDSRQLGKLPHHLLRGKVVARYWPPERAGWLDGASRWRRGRPPLAADPMSRSDGTPTGCN
jgi:nickel-type superoxide dismutase maturation protease